MTVFPPRDKWLLPLCPLQVFGGLVWVLVASQYILPNNPMAWVMFVSLFCFVITLVWMIVFGFGCHRDSSSWAAAVRAHRRTQSSHHTPDFWYVSWSACMCVCVCPGFCLSWAGSALLPQCSCDIGLHHHHYQLQPNIPNLQDLRFCYGKNSLQVKKKRG